MVGECLIAFYALAATLSSGVEHPVWPDEYAGIGSLWSNAGVEIARFRLKHSKSKEADRYDLHGRGLSTSVINVKGEEVSIAWGNHYCYFIAEKENPYGSRFIMPDFHDLTYMSKATYVDGTQVEDWRNVQRGIGAYIERKGRYAYPKAIWGPESVSNFTSFNQRASRCSEFDYTLYKASCQGPPGDDTFNCVD